MSNLRYGKGWCYLNPLAASVIAISPWHIITCRVGGFWPGVTSEAPLTSTTKSFAEICQSEAVALWAKHKKVLVLWSGGVDSSLVATFMAKTRPADGQLMLGSSHGSSPDFDNNLMAWYFEQDISFCQADPARLNEFVAAGWHVVTGVHADTLLSGDIVRYGHLYNDIHNIGIKDLISKMAKTEDDKKVDELYGHLKPLIDLMPLQQTAANFAWWLDYTCAWDMDSMATWQVFGVHPNNYTDFFGAIDFQRWSIKDSYEKIGSTEATHKQIYHDLLASLLPFTPEIVRTEMSYKTKSMNIWEGVVGVTEDWQFVYC